MAKVLISDALSKAALRIFEERGVEADFRPGIGADPAALAQALAGCDGLAIRSATRVTAAVLAAAPGLRVIGRAGIGIDNVDLAAATRAGVIVMNTPFGNSVTTAEHTIALMFATARQLPEANASTHAGLWEKSRFLGVELFNKTLGVIGAGNIGSIVCDRARGLKMKVIVFDPYLSEERARDLGVTRVSFEDVLARADFITLHVPLTDKTRHILGRDALSRVKRGVRIINCARGGLVDEAALAEALKEGRVAGAAFDVFEEEPARTSPLFGLPGVVCTPHLGAATVEAQENVALQVAEQICDYLLTGAVTNALNMPNVTAAEAGAMAPWIALAGHLGAFIGQMTDEPVKALNILYDGRVAEMNLAALNQMLIAGVLRPQTPEANLISAPVIARERGMRVSTTRQEKSGAFDAYIKVTMVTEHKERSIAGTVFADGKPRFIQIKGINLDAEVGRHMLYTTNRDTPGIIGTLGTILGRAGVNIADFTLGRAEEGGEAIAILHLDAPLAPEVAGELAATGQFGTIRPLVFETE